MIDPSYSASSPVSTEMGNRVCYLNIQPATQANSAWPFLYGQGNE